MNKMELLDIIEQAAKEGVIELSLNSMGLTEILSEIALLSNLMRLDLSDNQLRELPPEIGKLPNLTELNLKRNQLSKLPPEIFYLTKLTKLDLGLNQVNKLPPEIGQLINLTELILYGNLLSELPPEIGQLTNLRVLNLHENRLNSLPQELSLLDDSVSLDVVGNPLKSPPSKIAVQGIGAIRDYFRQLSLEDGGKKEEPSPADRQFQSDAVTPITPPDNQVFQSDSPSKEDRLGRRGFAIALGNWLSDYWNEFNKTESQSFAVHIQGQWGAGKTTLLNLLQEELQKNKTPIRGNPEPEQGNRSWIVVWFNAWQHQHVEPVWWPLMDKIYRQTVEQLRDTYNDRELAQQIYNWERRWRFRTGNNFYLLALVVSLLVLVVLLLLPLQTGIPKDNNYIGVVASIAKTATGVIALLISVWSGVRFFTRSYFFGSSSSAELFLKLAPDPLEQIKSHFDELIRKINRPIIVYIDDLDRCNAEHVVQLVESIQTLFSHQRVFYAVASDRRWLYVCFETVYEDFLKQINEPGRRLGYLFLEKFFQLSVSIPQIPKDRRKAFFDYILKVKQPEEQLEDMWEEAEREFEEVKSRDELIEKASISTGDEVKDQIRAEFAVAKSSSQDIVISDKHFLQQFEHLLEPNPRAMKRLVNAYGVYSALALQSKLEIISTVANRKKLALWTIVSLRWPMLAEYLEGNPSDVQKIRNREPLFEQQERSELRSLDMNDEIIRVLNGDKIGVELDEGSIKLLSGIKDSRRTPTVIA